MINILNIDSCFRIQSHVYAVFIVFYRQKILVLVYKYLKYGN
jgi:hypothetical protein